MRLLAVFGVLFAAYAATLALPGRGSDDRSAREARYLMVATSLHEDGDLAVADEYRDRAYREFHRGVLRPPSEPHAGRLLEGVGIGLPLLAAPLLGLGGVTAVALLCAAAMALAMTLGAVLARRIVPDPWATGAALAVGLSPPALGAAAAIGPEPLGAALLAGAAVCALRIRDADPNPPLWLAIVAAIQLAVLPWLNAELVLAGLVVLAAIVRWMMGAGRRLQGLVAAEIVVFSAIVYISVNERLFGGIVPRVVQGGPATGADGVARVPRARDAARDAVGRPGEWPPRLGARARARVPRAVAALALAARAPRARDARPARRRGRGDALRARVRRAAPRRRVPRPGRGTEPGSRGCISWRRCRSPARCAPGACAARRAPASPSPR